MRKLTGKKIGILGKGYIAKNLITYLTRLKKTYEFDLFLFDRSNLADVKFGEFDYFFNCAGITGDFRKNIQKTIDSNITLLNFLLNNLIVNESFINLSSTRIYGFTPQKECLYLESETPFNGHLNIDFIYDGSKLLQESMCYNYSNSLSFKIIVLRLSNVIGSFATETLDDSTFLKKLIKDKLNNDTTWVNFNPYVFKDYVYIEDVVTSMLNSAVNIQDDFCLLNIGSGQSFSIESLSNLFDFSVRYSSNDHAPMYSNISIQKAFDKIGFIPTDINSLTLKNLFL